jgi:hypothetical protein
VIFGVSSPVEASSVATRLMTEGWEALVGGDLEFIPDWDEMLQRALELIDAKRAALKLKPYDPTQFGDSGDSPYFAAIKAYLAEKAAEEAAGVSVVGSAVYPLAEGHSHDHGDGQGHGHGDDAGPLHAHGNVAPAGAPAASAEADAEGA